VSDRSENFSVANDNKKTKLKFNFIQLVDSIARGKQTASHFAIIYGRVMEEIQAGLPELDSASQEFVIRFENSFADYFLQACMDNENGVLPDSSGWKCLFTHPGAKGWQLALIGTNAHANRDLCQALVNHFTERDIRQYKKLLLGFQLPIATVYYPFFDQLKAENSNLRFMNGITKGLAKKFGERLICKWGRRQVRLALLYFHNPKKFKKKIAIVRRKKERIDRLILDRKKIIIL